MARTKIRRPLPMKADRTDTASFQAFFRAGAGGDRPDDRAGRNERTGDHFLAQARDRRRHRLGVALGSHSGGAAPGDQPDADRYLSSWLVSDGAICWAELSRESSRPRLRGGSARAARWRRNRDDFGRLAGEYRVSEKQPSERADGTATLSGSGPMLTLAWTLEDGSEVTGTLSMNEQSPVTGAGSYEHTRAPIAGEAITVFR
jgi:hypothetical protein